PRLPAVVLGRLHGDGVGLVDVHRHHRPVPDTAVPVHPLPADDLDLRNADAAARGRPAPRGRRQRGGGRRGRGGGARMKHPVYGVVAEYDNLPALVAAVNQTRAAGYTRFEAYTPFPSEELNEAIGYHYSRLPLVVFLGGLFGGLAGYGLQYYTAVVHYPL